MTEFLDFLWTALDLIGGLLFAILLFVDLCSNGLYLPHQVLWWMAAFALVRVVAHALSHLK